VASLRRAALIESVRYLPILSSDMSYNLFQTVFRDSRFRGEIATDRSLEMHDHMTLLAMDVLEELVMPNCLFANSLGGEKQSDMMSPNEMDDYPSGEKT